MDTQINFIDDQKDILDHFGIEAQIEKFFEEVEELREAIKLKNKVMIREELADVHNVLMQLIFHYGVRMIYKKAVDKLLRTKERIKSGYYTITDGHQSWNKKCPECGKMSMVIVRPGKVQCNKCG